MKKTAIKKKWRNIASEPDWVENTDPVVRQKVLSRNAELRAEKEKKSASINTRILPSDLERLKEIAMAKAIPYQTFLGHIIHEYVLGKLVDVEEIRKLNPDLKTKKTG